MLCGEAVIRGKQGWIKAKDRVVEKNHQQATDVAEYVFKLASGQSNKTWTVRAARPHQWPLITGKSTYDLRIGDVVAPVSQDMGYSDRGWLHGFLFRQKHTGASWFCLDNDYHRRFRGRIESLAIEKRNQGQGIWYYRFDDLPYTSLPNQWDMDFRADYWGSFVTGFMQSVPSEDRVDTNSLVTAEWIQKYAPYGGYIASGDITSHMRTNKAPLAKDSTFHQVYVLKVIRGEQHGGFRVRDVRIIRDPVTVVYDPTVDQLCLEGGILTYP